MPLMTGPITLQSRLKLSNGMVPLGPKHGPHGALGGAVLAVSCVRNMKMGVVTMPSHVVGLTHPIGYVLYITASYQVLFAEQCFRNTRRLVSQTHMRSGMEFSPLVRTTVTHRGLGMV